MNHSNEAKPTRNDVVATVQHDFPNEDSEVVLAILDRYGLKGFHREHERVHLAILKLSEGNLRRVIDYTKAAENDYRDVLMWVSETPPPTLAEQEARQYAQHLMRRTGIDPENLPKWTPAHVICPVCGEEEPVVQIIWCDNRPMKESFAKIPIRGRDDPYISTGDVQPLREFAFGLLCRNNHRWLLTAHLSGGGVEWDIVIIDQG